MLLINAIGFSNSGKTTLLETLAKHYYSIGKTVAVIKDIHNEKYQPDKEGTDTWRYSQAGVQLVVGRGLHNTVFHWRERLNFLEILGKVKTEIMLVEGFKEEKMPRIVCAVEKSDLAQLVDSQTYCISGKISDTLEEFQHIPVYNFKRDLQKIIALVEKNSARVE